MPTILAVAGSAIILLWGIAHIVPTRSVVAGFGPLAADNLRIITMEWVAEGFTLVFIGLLVLYTTLSGSLGNSGAHIVYWAAAIMLLIMAAWTALTGARTVIVAIKICPFVKATVAIMFILATVL